MNIYDVYMDGEEAVIKADRADLMENKLAFLVGEEVVALFQAHVWLWFEKRQVEEN